MFEDIKRLTNSCLRQHETNKGAKQKWICDCRTNFMSFLQDYPNPNVCCHLIYFLNMQVQFELNDGMKIRGPFSPTTFPSQYQNSNFIENFALLFSKLQWSDRCKFFAHDATAFLSLHGQIFVVIWTPAVKLKWYKLSNEIEFWCQNQ